ncbi:MAG: gluconate 2-dehydrogenase subunit 3 family protein [Vicinamibacterales bacterium]
MRAETSASVSRRRFIGGTLAIAGALPFAPVVAAVSPAATNAARMPGPAAGYKSLTATDAAFVEAMVNALCPADRLTADGVSSGLAAFVDAHLGGEVDAGVHGQRELFRAGMKAADEACRDRFGRAFHELDLADARQFLRDIAAGDVAGHFPLASWSSDVVAPVLKHACFSGPVYDVYGGRMFWKLFG